MEVFSLEILSSSHTETAWAHGSYHVSAPEEKSVVSDGQRSSNRPNERTYVSHVFSCGHTQ